MQIPASQVEPDGQLPLASQVPAQQTPTSLLLQGPMPQVRQHLSLAQSPCTWQLPPLEAAHAAAASRRPSAIRRIMRMGASIAEAQAAGKWYLPATLDLFDKA